MTEPNCRTCRWWRNQSGSAHVMCPSDFDWAWSWGPSPCDLYAPVRPSEEVKRDGCNQFLHWSTGSGGVPTREEALAYLRDMVGTNDLKGEK
jgi:hypothetical protein